MQCNKKREGPCQPLAFFIALWVVAELLNALPL